MTTDTTTTETTDADTVLDDLEKLQKAAFDSFFLLLKTTNERDFVRVIMAKWLDLAEAYLQFVKTGEESALDLVAEDLKVLVTFPVTAVAQAAIESTDASMHEQLTEEFKSLVSDDPIETKEKALEFIKKLV